MDTEPKNIRCYRIEKRGERGQVMSIPSSSLTPGAVRIHVRYSSVNYKDALAGLAVSPYPEEIPFKWGY